MLRVESTRCTSCAINAVTLLLPLKPALALADWSNTIGTRGCFDDCSRAVAGALTGSAPIGSIATVEPTMNHRLALPNLGG